LTRCRGGPVAVRPHSPAFRFVSGEVVRVAVSRRAVGGPPPKFDVTASTDYCTFLRHPFTRRTNDARVASNRTHCSALVPTSSAGHDCVFRHVSRMPFSKKWLPISSHVLALRRQASRA